MSDSRLLGPAEELVRQAYLEALGIVQYCPADADSVSGLVLPHWEPVAVAVLSAEEPQKMSAAPAPKLDAPVSAGLEPEAIEAPVRPTRTVTEPAPEPVADSGAKPEASPAARPAVTVPMLDSGAEIRLDSSRILGGEQQLQSTSRVRAKASSAAVNAFTLLFVTTEQCLLAVECGVADAPGLSALESRWVSDLLRGLGVTEPEAALTRARHFRWPVLNAAFGANDLEAAGEALLSFLDGSGCQQPLVMLGAPSGIISGLERGQPGQLTALGALPCLQAASLGEMQADMGCKRAVWQQLCQFLKR